MLEKLTSLLLILLIVNLISPDQCCKKGPSYGRILSIQCKSCFTPSNEKPIPSFSDKTVIIGDMQLTKDQYERMYSGRKKVESVYDSGISAIKNFRWPDGIIPYEISPNFLQHETEVIIDVIDEFNYRFKDHIMFK